MITVDLAGYSEQEKIGAIKYSNPELSAGNPIKFNPKGLWTPTIDADNIAYHSLFQPFNLNQYLYPRPPIDMGYTIVEDCSVNVLRTPIKFPNSEYRIPRQLEVLFPLIQRVAEYEKFINAKHDDCFCHITYDKSSVNAGEYHRFPCFHPDGLQGFGRDESFNNTKPIEKTNVEHSYIIVSEPPTEFCLQPFFVKHLDESKHNFFLEFDRQAKEANIYGSLPNHLYLIDPYMIHRSPKIRSACERVFVRITYTFTELTHPKNTINPLFDGQQYNNRIDIRENLVLNEFDVPLHLYGLSPHLSMENL
jgi:hypothetical protein